MPNPRLPISFFIEKSGQVVSTGKLSYFVLRRSESWPIISKIKYVA